MKRVDIFESEAHLHSHAVRQQRKSVHHKFDFVVQTVQRASKHGAPKKRHGDQTLQSRQPADGRRQPGPVVAAALPGLYTSNS